MRIASRLTVLATAAVAGLGLTAAIPAAASLTPHTRTATTALWVSRFRSGHGPTAGRAVAVSPDGATVFVTGDQAPTARITHGETVAYDTATGAQIWQTEDTAGVVSGFASIAVSPDGSTVFVTGFGNPVSRTNRQLVTVAYNAATGAVLWTQAMGSHAAGGSVRVSPDGSTVFVAGSGLCGKPVNSCYVTAAYDAATGAALWTQELANIGSGGSLAVSPDGSAVYVTGTVLSRAGSPHTLFSTVAYNAATGAMLWTATDNAPVGPIGPTIAVSPTGSAVFVAGSTVTNAAGTTESYRTIAYSAATGAQLWVQSFPSKKNGLPYALAVSPDGSKVFVTGGVSTMTSNSDYGTVTYNATTGAQLWKALYQGPSSGGAAAVITVSPDGSKVFVSGYDYGLGGSPQYATVAYDSGTGARVWVARYGDTALGASYAYGLAVSPDGSKVFVTGASINNLTTLAYRS